MKLLVFIQVRDTYYLRASASNSIFLASNNSASSIQIKLSRIKFNHQLYKKLHRFQTFISYYKNCYKLWNISYFCWYICHYYKIELAIIVAVLGSVQFSLAELYLPSNKKQSWRPNCRCTEQEINYYKTFFDITWHKFFNRNFETFCIVVI